MIENVLAAIEPQTRWWDISIGWYIVFLIYGCLVALIIIGLIRLVRFLGSAGKEMKLTRMEVGKLAEEVHLLRQELKGWKSSSESS